MGAPIGECPIHGNYYARFEGHDGCPVCARKTYGSPYSGEKSSSEKRPSIKRGGSSSGAFIGALIGFAGCIVQGSFFPTHVGTYYPVFYPIIGAIIGKIVGSFKQN